MTRGAPRIAVMFALLGMAWCVGASQPATKATRVVRGETSKSFDDVILELDFAITERNFRITGRNTIGKGLRDRGYKDFPNVEVIHFCNLEYAREVLLIDPGFVAEMPCRIAAKHSLSRGDFTQKPTDQVACMRTIIDQGATT